VATSLIQVYPLSQLCKIKFLAARLYSQVARDERLTEDRIYKSREMQDEIGKSVSSLEI
jgi:hypothetical protein